MSALVETMFYRGQIPWHGEGTKLENPPTSAEAIVASGLDWRVETQPIYAETMIPGDYEKVDLGQVVRRTSDGSILGLVGPQWTPVQNRDAFGFFDPLVQDGLAVYHTAGSLCDGKTIWILAQIGEARNVVGEDNIGQFLLLSMGHDGKKSVQVMPTPIRVVCANTLGMAERKKDQTIRIQHRKNAVTRLEQLRDFIRPHLLSFDRVIDVFQLLAKAQVTPEKLNLYLNELVPDPENPESSCAYARRVRAEITAKFEGDLMGYDVIPPEYQKTWWTLYNSVTEYICHDRATERTRLNSTWFGSGKLLTEKALELAANMA